MLPVTVSVIMSINSGLLNKEAYLNNIYIITKGFLDNHLNTLHNIILVYKCL